MFRRNSWARGPREEHTRLDFGFWFLLFSEPFVISAQTRIDNCIIQQIPARWGALKPLSEKSEHLTREQAWPGLGERKTGWEIREEAPVVRGVNPRKWECGRGWEPGKETNPQSLVSTLLWKPLVSRTEGVRLSNALPQLFFFFF